MPRAVLCPNFLTYFKPRTLKTEIKIFASMYVVNEHSHYNPVTIKGDVSVSFHCDSVILSKH